VLSGFVRWNLRVSAVNYLNTWPLIWGFQHGPQRGLFDFRFDLPAQCADALGLGEADIGLVPSAELDRLRLDFFPDVGIACEGPVRSILLISTVPVESIRALAVDSGSRTSVALARIILGESYHCFPEIFAHEPTLDRMLARADAALVIGDPALRLEPAELGLTTLDLGEEWVRWTGLPMVFAVWAGSPEKLSGPVRDAFVRSWRWGRDHIEEIIRRAADERGFPEPLARGYLTRHIRYKLGPEHLEGLAKFRSLAAALPNAGLKLKQPVPVV